MFTWRGISPGAQALAVSSEGLTEGQNVGQAALRCDWGFMPSRWMYLWQDCHSVSADVQKAYWDVPICTGNSLPLCAWRIQVCSASVSLAHSDLYEKKSAYVIDTLRSLLGTVCLCVLGTFRFVLTTVCLNVLGESNHAEEKSIGA